MILDPSTLPWKLNDMLLIHRLEKIVTADVVFVLKCTIGRMDGLNMRYEREREDRERDREREIE
jgi:hypothetical protein